MLVVCVVELDVTQLAAVVLSVFVVCAIDLLLDVYVLELRYSVWMVLTVSVV
jgi:hypothetical protein